MSAWTWISQNVGLLWQYTQQNAYLGLLPVLFGVIIAVPLGVVCARWRWVYAPTLSVTSALYALPSIALFAILIDYTGLTNTTVIIPLTVFSLSILLPNVVDGLRSVPEPVRQSATAMGFSPMRRLVQVELPIAVPIVLAGLRVATVSSISLVSVGQLIGIGGLGYLLIDGEQRSLYVEVYAGIVLIVALALAADLVIVLIRRWLTPWQRGPVSPSQGSLLRSWLAKGWASPLGGAR
jgi:osmoprotectant transport system permease protein